jgi:hypothetical protein
LVSGIINTQADAVRGPVLAELDPSIPKSIAFWFRRESYSNYSQIFSLTTGNLILKCSSLREHKIWFDPRFNNSGSEDSFFGIQIMKKGGKIFWASEAITYEYIPPGRANLKWLIKRRFRISSTYSHILRIEGKYLLLLKKWIISAYYILTGLFLLVFLLFPIRIKYYGLIKITEGFGGLLGVYYTYKEYNDFSYENG